MVHSLSRKFLVRTFRSGSQQADTIHPSRHSSAVFSLAGFSGSWQRPVWL